jgi:hypothetical protein
MFPDPTIATVLFSDLPVIVISLLLETQAD